MLTGVDQLQWEMQGADELQLNWGFIVDNKDYIYSNFNAITCLQVPPPLGAPPGPCAPPCSPPLRSPPRCFSPRLSPPRCFSPLLSADLRLRN